MAALAAVTLLDVAMAFTEPILRPGIRGLNPVTMEMLWIRTVAESVANWRHAATVWCGPTSVKDNLALRLATTATLTTVMVALKVVR
jgi:hypothetical protein